MVPGFKATAIKPTKTVGQRLKAARKKKELSLEDAERLTKVKLKYLEALEEDHHDLLPTEVYSLGFLRCYGEVLSLNTTRLLDQYRLERQALKSAKNVAPQVLAPARRLGGPRFLLTPKTLFTTASVALVVGLIVYIISGVHSYLAPPRLRIDQPKADSRLPEVTVKVSGETDPSVALTINGDLIAVDQGGKFNYEVAILPGLNVLEFVAINRLNKETRQTRKVLGDFKIIPSPTPNPTPSPSVNPTPTFSPTPTPTSPSPRVTP